MILEERVLREAAFELLASSSLRRYIREATRLARDAQLTDAVPNDSATAEARADELLQQLQSETERTPAEFETAVLLCALARAGNVDSLRRAAESNSAWIRGLATWLQARGPSSVEEMISFGSELDSLLIGSVVVAQPVDSRDQGDRNAFPRAA